MCCLAESELKERVLLIFHPKCFSKLCSFSLMMKKKTVLIFSKLSFINDEKQNCINFLVFILCQYVRYTVHIVYFATVEVRFILSLTFWKLSLTFNLESLSQFSIIFYNQWQFCTHDERIPKLSLGFTFDEDFTEKKCKNCCWKVNDAYCIFHSKYLKFH